MKKQFWVALLSGAGTLATAAHAQTAPAPQRSSPAAQSTTDAPENQTQPGDTPVSQGANAGNDIVVTGSRVVSNGNNSPTPVTVLPTEQFLKLQPTTITEAVNLLPALQGSQNVTSRPGGGQRNGAGAYFNLRNMGNLRTLVLYDGQRLVPTINQNEADTDASIIPQMLIKRVDVVTGGVSAVYGSDAISGVINFITDRSFNGIKTQSSYSLSTLGDNPIFDVGIAGGMNFAGGRGHIEGSYEYHKDDGILQRIGTGRDFYDDSTGTGGNGTTVPYYYFPNSRASNFTYGGLILNAAANGALRDLKFNADGTLSPFVHGLIPTANGLIQGTTANAATGNPTNLEGGGDGTTNYLASLKAGIDFHQSFARLDYDLTDDIHFYAQGAYSFVHTFNNFQSPNLQGLRVSYGNAFLSSVQAPYQTTIQTLAANANNNFTFSRLILKEPRADQYTTGYLGYAGLEGKLGATWKWNVNGSWSQSKILAVNRINIDNGRLYAALDSVRNAAGQIVCRASLTNAAYANCVPLNLFGEGRASDQAYNYIYKETHIINRTRQEEINGSITGAPFSTWAGPVNVAVSGEYRRLRWDVQSDATPNDLANCGGVYNSGFANGTSGTVGAFASGACVQGRTLQWFFNTMSPLPTVTQKVGEVALEADVPLVKDVRFIDSFNVTGAARYTHYNTSGTAWTWKVGADWNVSDELRFRATRSRDIRAPNLFELYSPVQRNPGSAANNDPVLVNGVAASSGLFFVNVQTANPDLVPEKANTLTFGAVLKPHLIPRFSLSVDYFKINVDDAIFLLQGFSLPVLRLCSSAAPPAFCSTFVTRNPATGANPLAITQTLSTYLNIATFKTYGVDVEANYTQDIFNRPLNIRLLVSYQPQLDFDQGPAGVLKAAGTFNTGTNRIGAAPKWKITEVVSYDLTKDVNLTVLERWRSRLAANADRTLLFVNPTIAAQAYTTINLQFTKNTNVGQFNFFVNVANVFDDFPAALGNVPEGDDPIGRQFTTGLRLKF